MEFIAIFLVTLVLIGGTAAAMVFGRAPSYRPDRQQVLRILEGVADGSTRQEEWDMFVGLPILHDPELDSIRQRCLAIQEGDDQHPPAGSGLAGHVLDRANRARIAEVKQELEKLIRNQPVYREF